VLCVVVSYSSNICIGPAYAIQNKTEATPFRVIKLQTGWAVIFVAKWHKGLDCNWTSAMEAPSSENLLDVVNLGCGSVECDETECERQ
jgi:hypothetical protein